MNLGANIKKLREVKNLTQQELAKKLGITQRAYSKIENEEVNLSVSKLLEIAKILNVNPADILPNDGSHVYNNIVTNQKGNGFVINQAEKAIELYERLLQEKEAQNKQLHEMINLLKKSKS